MLDYHRNRKLDTTDMNKVSRKREIIGSTYKVWDSIFPFIEVEKKKYIYIQNLLFKFKLKI